MKKTLKSLLRKGVLIASTGLSCLIGIGGCSSINPKTYGVIEVWSNQKSKVPLYDEEELLSGYKSNVKEEIERLALNNLKGKIDRWLAKRNYAETATFEDFMRENKEEYEQKLKELLERLDTNRDKFITLEELYRETHKMPKILPSPYL